MVASAQVGNRQSCSANRKKSRLRHAIIMCSGNLLLMEQWHGVERQENDFSRQNKADIAENAIGRLRIQCARDNVKEKTLF